MQQRTGRRPGCICSVRMPHPSDFASLGWLAIDWTVSHFENFRVDAMTKVHRRMQFELTEIFAEGNMLRDINVLIRKHQNLILQPSFSDFLDGRVRKRL